MPRKRVFDQQASWGGGLNTTADESQLGKYEMRRADNARLTEYGGVTKRLGSQRIHASAIGSGNQVKAGYSWGHGAAVSQLAVANGTLHTGTYGIPMSWTAQSGGMSSTVYPSIAAFFDSSNEVAYIADGGALNKWDGTSFSTNLSGTPNVTQICVQNLRLFGIGDTAAPQTLYWSGLSNGDTLNDTMNGGGSAVIRTFGEQALQALLAIGDSLLIFHTRGISVFTGYSQDDINVNSGTRGLSSDVGTIAPKTCVAVENVGYFLSDRGIYSVDPIRGVQSISSPIEATIKGLDRSLFNRALAAHNPVYREVLFYLPDLGVYAYNYRTGGWTGPWNGLLTTHVPGSLWTAQDSSATPIVLTGMDDGFVRQLDAPSKYKDDYLSDGTGGTAFTMVARTRRFFFGDPYSEKSLRYIYVLGNTRGSVNAGVNWETLTYDGTGTIASTSGVTWGNFTWGSFTWGGFGSLSQRVQASGRGPFTDVEIVDSGTADAVYSQVQVEGFDLGRRF